MGLDHVAFNIGTSLDELREARAKLTAAGVATNPIDHEVTKSLYFQRPGRQRHRTVRGCVGCVRREPQRVAQIRAARALTGRRRSVDQRELRFDRLGRVGNVDLVEVVEALQRFGERNQHPLQRAVLVAIGGHDRRVVRLDDQIFGAVAGQQVARPTIRKCSSIRNSATDVIHVNVRAGATMIPLVDALDPFGGASN